MTRKVSLKGCQASLKTKKADILLYCIPVGPGSKFDDANPVTMRCLTEVYGREIWGHCVLVFTMSDITLRELRDQNRDTATDQYKIFLDQYAKRFKEELHHRDIKVDKEVKTVFNLKDTLNAVITVPVGRTQERQVLPGIDQLVSEFHPDLASHIHNHDPTWIDVLFAVIASKCPADFQESVLKYRYGEELAHKIIVRAGAGIGGVGGGALGALVGGLLGLLGGPPGVLAGMGVGITVGASLLGGTGGTAAGHAANKLYGHTQKKKTAKEVYEMQNK